MTRSFVVRVYEICCWALGFVGARVRWEDVRLVVTSFIACWGARCCLQAHIRYRVKFVARVLECLLFASSCQLCYVVKFVAHLAPLQPHVARLLELSWGKGLVADLWNHQTLVLHFTTLLKGEGGTKQKPWFSLWQNSSFWRDVFQCRKKLEKRRRSTRYLPCCHGDGFWNLKNVLWKGGLVIETTLKLAILCKRRAQNRVLQTAPVLVPRHLRGTKTGAVWRAQFWARLLRKFASLSVISITVLLFQNVLQVAINILMVTVEVTFLRRSLGHGFKGLELGSFSSCIPCFFAKCGWWLPRTTVATLVGHNCQKLSCQWKVSCRVAWTWTATQLQHNCNTNCNTATQRCNLQGKPALLHV